MPLYEYQCGACNGWAEKISAVDARPNSIKCPSCGGRAQYSISMPVVQTLATHMRGVKGIESGCDGSYLDENICDPKTGRPTVIRSKGHKMEMLKQYGLHMKEESSPQVRDRDSYNRRRPISVS